MKELIKFLKYFLVSNFLLILLSCDTSSNTFKENEIMIIKPIILTREDSIKQLANDLNIEFDANKDNVNVILNKILITKRELISKLDSLDERADQMENLAYEFKKKEDKAEKERLLSEIMIIKKELERIRVLSGTESIKKDSTSIAEVKVPIETSTFENLPPGNYTTRIDKYHLLSIYVKPNGEVIIGQPRLDSTTVIKGERKINPRLKKELEQIRKKLNNKFN